jgi:hypothetical protein
MSIRIVQSSIASSVCCVAAAVCVCAVSRVWGVKHSDDLLWYIAPENLVQKTVAIPSQGAESTREGSSQRLRSGVGHRLVSVNLTAAAAALWQFQSERYSIEYISDCGYYMLIRIYTNVMGRHHNTKRIKRKLNQIRSKYIYVRRWYRYIIYTCLPTFKSLMTRNWEMVLHQYGTRNYFQDK